VNGASADYLLYQQDLMTPGYADSINHFWYYAFEIPVPLDAGTFYAGTIQPAAGSSDSLYIGLDVNRIGTNHAYYSVLNQWNPSLISGALMIRPILGQAITGTRLTEVKPVSHDWQVMPNPAKDIVRFEFGGDANPSYQFTDIQGNTVLKGKAISGNDVDVSQLAPGMYFVNLISNGVAGAAKKIIKL
jgi:hypothetical protein